MGVLSAVLAGFLLASSSEVASGDASPKPPITPTPAAEVVLGEQALERFLAARPLSEDGSLALRVDRIGHALARVSDRPDCIYTFLVVAGRALQAYSFTGGTVCLTDSLARLQASEDELAFAIAHELAHVALRHVVSEASFEEALRVGGPRDPVAARNLHGHTSELEADRYGALYACRAGFRFSAGIDSLDRLSRVAPGPDEDLRHPPYT